MASTYLAYAEGAGTFTLSSPFDVKLGLGYRFAFGALGQREKPSRSSFDLFANLDIGQFQRASGSIAGEGRFEGDITRPALHYLVEFGVTWHWTP